MTETRNESDRGTRKKNETYTLILISIRENKQRDKIC